MSRINTNVQSMVAARVLNMNNEGMGRSLHRLSTGLRINTGRDDPAGLIASETMRAEKKAIVAAMDNARAADNMLGVTEAALGEISSLLLDLEDLVDRSANQAALSDNEVAANQLQIDTILSSIDRLSQSITYKGQRLLNGSFDYTLSGTGGAVLADIQIQGAKLVPNETREVVVEKVLSAQTGTLAWSATAAGGTLNGSVTIEVTGNFGTDQFSFASSTSIANMATAINASKELTGVSATTSGGVALRFHSTGFGSDQFVSIEKVSGGSTFDTVDIDGATVAQDYGRDAQVRINGRDAVTNGLRATVRSAVLTATVTIAESANTDTGTYTFGIKGGGATFSLAPDLGLTGFEGIGLGNMATTSLGDASIGRLSTIGAGKSNQMTSKNFATAQRIIRSSQDQVSGLRGRIGAFQANTLKTTINALGVALENTSAAESAIRDTDYATETSTLTRQQILVQSSTVTLQMANQMPQNVLALLGG
ncbi:MAG: flagellin [Phycisphaerae bacterium]|nr:flagellin [Phycisphaerae bacterium]